MCWNYDIGMRNALVTDLQLARARYASADVCLPGNTAPEALRKQRNTTKRSEIDGIIQRLLAGKGFVDRNDARWGMLRQQSNGLHQVTNPCQGMQAVITHCAVLDQSIAIAGTQLVEH